MTERDMRRLVGWTVEDTPTALAVARRLESVLHAVSTVASIGADATSGARPPTWSVPADPDAFVDIGVLRRPLARTRRRRRSRVSLTVTTRPAGSAGGR